MWPLISGWDLEIWRQFFQILGQFFGFAEFLRIFQVSGKTFDPEYYQKFPAIQSYPPHWIWSTDICFQNLQIFHYILLNFAIFRGGATFEKHADPEKQNRNSRKSRANSRNLLEPFLRSRKEENLDGHCAMNNARRILSKGSTLLRGCWFWSKKLRFRKNFDENFNVVERVTSSSIV